MMTLLEHALDELPALLASTEGWRGMHIDYLPPHVDRAWRPWRECRLAIHRIHPIAAGGTAFLHPHPWPSAMAILDGSYEMSLGHGAGVVAPPIAAQLVMGPGTRYAMTDRDAWHDVRPVSGPVISVMLSGPPWEREMPAEPEVTQRPLTSEELGALLAEAHVLLAKSSSSSAALSPITRASRG
ncbi:MAG: hypothetical protein ACKV2T_03920 [Kofleriaceae bacterium]